MRLSSFITFQSEGCFYILQTAFPNYIGKIERLGSDNEVLYYGIKEMPLGYCQVSGYRIMISFAGSIKGNQLLFYSGWKDELDGVLSAMADFYLKERILVAENKFKKYLIV